MNWQKIKCLLKKTKSEAWAGFIIGSSSWFWLWIRHDYTTWIIQLLLGSLLIIHATFRERWVK